MPPYDTLWLDAHLVTMCGDDLGIVTNAALAARDGRIAWIGRASELPARADSLAERVIGCDGDWITPGFVDAHTHAIFGGERIADFERRNAGASYEQLASAGGGIALTVEQTRASSEVDLLATAATRLGALARSGVTTVEVKSGYGLDVETELRMLRVARALRGQTGIDVRATYLGAHVVPPEFRARREAYFDLICDVMIPRVARDGLADAVDVFADALACTNAETVRVLEAARAAGLPVKLHADQRADGGGAELAARFGAISADHLDHASDAGIAALAASGTVAVLLPGATHYLHERERPPIAAMRAAGVPIAIATDCNPGTSPIRDMTIALNFACVMFGLSAAEALRGVTVNAARALGLDDRGTLAVGNRCDLARWQIASPNELPYWLGAPPCREVVVAGVPLVKR